MQNNLSMAQGLQKLGKIQEESSPSFAPEGACTYGREANEPESQVELKCAKTFVHLPEVVIVFVWRYHSPEDRPTPLLRDLGRALLCFSFPTHHHHHHFLKQMTCLSSCTIGCFSQKAQQGTTVAKNNPAPWSAMTDFGGPEFRVQMTQINKSHALVANVASLEVV